MIASLDGKCTLLYLDLPSARNLQPISLHIRFSDLRGQMRSYLGCASSQSDHHRCSVATPDPDAGSSIVPTHDRPCLHLSVPWSPNSEILSSAFSSSREDRKRLVLVYASADSIKLLSANVCWESRPLLRTSLCVGIGISITLRLSANQLVFGLTGPTDLFDMMKLEPSKQGWGKPCSPPVVQKLPKANT